MTKRKFLTPEQKIDAFGRRCLRTVPSFGRCHPLPPRTVPPTNGLFSARTVNSVFSPFAELKQQAEAMAAYVSTMDRAYDGVEGISRPLSTPKLKNTRLDGNRSVN